MKFSQTQPDEKEDHPKAAEDDSSQASSSQSSSNNNEDDDNEDKDGSSMVGKMHPSEANVFLLSSQALQQTRTHWTRGIRKDSYAAPKQRT